MKLTYIVPSIATSFKWLCYPIGWKRGNNPSETLRFTPFSVKFILWKNHLSDHFQIEPISCLGSWDVFKREKKGGHHPYFSPTGQNVSQRWRKRLKISDLCCSSVIFCLLLGKLGWWPPFFFLLKTSKLLEHKLGSIWKGSDKWFSHKMHLNQKGVNQGISEGLLPLF